MDWKLNIQEILDLIEGDLKNKITLEKIARYIGYSKYHTTRRFKDLTGSTLRKYIQLRRLSDAALDMRDTDERILDIAFKYEFSSQEAFTKSFHDVFGITPGEYRKTVVPLNLTLKRNIIISNLESGELIMDFKKEVEVKKLTLQKHKFVMLKRLGVDNYIDFWELIDKEANMDCDELNGYLASLPGLYKEPFGALYEENGVKGYMFGMAVSAEYNHEFRNEFEIIDIEESEYLAFEHSRFNDDEFMDSLLRTRELANNYDSKQLDLDFDSSFVIYYEHSGLIDNFYYIRKPIK
ncbi:AraC family transcriptional regulator [Mycoplasmatota bacterium WC44]